MTTKRRKSAPRRGLTLAQRISVLETVAARMSRTVGDIAQQLRVYTGPQEPAAKDIEVAIPRGLPFPTSSGGGCSAAPPAPSPSPLMENNQQARRLLDNLHDEIAVLEARLEPVLASPSPAVAQTGPGRAPSPGSSPFTGSQSGVTGAIFDALNRLNAIRNRLEV